MNALIDAVLRKWRREGLRLLPPAGESEVLAALGRLGRKFSRDVVALYCATGGMAEGEVDSEMWALWPLGRVVSENARYARPHILFADFMIDSHLFCFRFESEGVSSVCVDYFDGREPGRVAGSVAEFFELYLNGAGSLAGPRRP